MDYLMNAFLTELKSNRLHVLCHKSLVDNEIVYTVDFSKVPDSFKIPYIDKSNFTVQFTKENYARRIIEIGNYFRSY